MRSRVRYGVFIEPEGAVRDLVAGWKRRLAASWPQARYLRHPPHATVWVGELTSPSKAALRVAHSLAGPSSCTVYLSHPHVFYDDAPAGGGQTLAFAATRTKELSDLQASVCDALEPYVEVSYPFAGRDWIPHFTAASLPVPKEDPVLREFLSVDVGGLTVRCQRSWWHIYGDQHERLAWL